MEVSSRDGLPTPALYNTTVETGIRAVIVLNALYPRACGLAEITCFDHAVVHSGDLGGPSSLHPDLRDRGGELVVRRNLIDESLRLMRQVHLVDEVHDAEGIRFVAASAAPSFLSLMQAPYTGKLKDRAHWVKERFGHLTPAEVEAVVDDLIGRWRSQFGPPAGFPGPSGTDGGQ